MSDTITIEAPEPVAAPAPAAAPVAGAPAPAPAASAPSPATPEPAAAPAAPAPAPADKSAWRAVAVAEVLGEAKDDDPPESKAERDKMLKLAARYTTMGAALKALRDANVRISAGIKEPLPKNASEDQIKAWRAENGIPETPDKYDLGLKEGTVLADGDKALLDDWVKRVHGANASPDVVKAGAAALIELRDAQAAAAQQRDREHMAELQGTLIEEWGKNDYQANVDGVKSMLASAPQGVAEMIMNARGPDGMAIANSPDVLRWLSGHARELGFVGHTLTPGGGDPLQSVENEIQAIEKSMYDASGNRDPAYWKDDKKQKRYMQLLDARARRK